MKSIFDKKFKFTEDGGTELHGKILRKLDDRLTMAEKKRGEQHARWALNEQIFRLYAKAEKKKTFCDDSEAGDNPYKYETIVVPYSYAILMTMHTYLATVFFARDPIFQLLGYSTDKGIGPQAMEALLQYQLTAGDNQIPYFIWLLDMLKYGEGWVGTYWDKRIITCGNMVSEPETINGIATGRSVTRVERKNLTQYEGNSVFNVKPTDMFPDPRVSLANFQKGEFIIRETTLSKYDIETGNYFNKQAAIKSRMREERNKLATETQQPETQLDIPNAKTSDTYTVHEHYVRLIPDSWEIDPQGKAYEIWSFTVVNRSVIIDARPLGAYHGSFPFDTMLAEFNIYEISAQGPLDTLQGLNDALTWLLNSHMFNVRKVMNDSMIYDPSRINERDFLKNRAGRMARLRPSAYGTKPSDSIYQMQVFDVTQGHVRDMDRIMDFMQRTMGVNDNLMGTVNPGGRKTATEIRTSSTSSANRMQILASFLSALGMTPHTHKLLSNNQQYYADEMNLRIAGSLVSSDYQGKDIAVSPESIAGKFHYLPVDGVLPVDRFLQANMYKEIFSTALQIPAMQQRYDLPRLFAYSMTLSGIKNMAQFELTPDQAAQQQAQAGNLVEAGQE